MKKKAVKYLIVCLVMLLSLALFCACGTKGETGPQGIQGEQGIPGEKGETGAQGPQGEKGETGAQGPQGEKGETGAQGPQGEKGETGAQGPQGEKGETGAQGPHGEKGETGAQGPQGEKGETGAQGPQGEKGETGAQGSQGAKGEKGEDSVHANEKHTVKFDAQGGDLPRDFQSTQTVNYGDVLNLPIPERENFTFLGWFTGDTVNDGQFTTVTPVTKDITLYARWQAKTKYRVTFDTQDGDAMDPVEYFSDDVIEKLPDPKRTDYNFAGWYYDEQYEERVQYPLTLTGEIIVFARWEKATFTVTFHVNVGKTPESIRAEGGTKLNSFTAPQVKDYEFRGWYYDAEYEKKVSFPLVLHSDLDIYGYWEKDPLAEYTKIDDVMQLQKITDMNGKYVLTKDIDCLGFQIPMFAPDGNPFTGEFDGAGHKIYNFSIYVSSGNKIGFFGVNEGTIQNLKIEQLTLTVSGGWGYRDGLMCSAFVGYNKGQIKNVAVSANFKFNNSAIRTFYPGSIVGGVAGKNEGTISNVQYTGSLSAVSNADPSYNATCFHFVGGVVGENTGTVEKAFVSAQISTQTASGGSRCSVGGVVGRNAGKVESCLFNGDVTDDKHKCQLNAICALIAENGTQQQCYKTYTVSVEGGSVATEDYLNKKLFYTDILGWDEQDWDLSSLNFGSGVYPKLRMN